MSAASLLVFPFGRLQVVGTGFHAPMVPCHPIPWQAALDTACLVVDAAAPEGVEGAPPPSVCAREATRKLLA